MRFQSGITDQYIPFVALDSTDLKTRETGLSSFTVYRSRNGGAATAFTTPTVTELSAANMPGVYALLLDEDMTIDSGNDSEAVVLHITQASMAPVTLMYELYRPIVTAGTTITVANGCADADIERLQGSAIATPTVAGVLEVDVTHFNGSAGTFASGRPEVNTSHIAGSAVSTSSAQIGVNVVNAGGTAWGSGAITAASIAADAITAAKVASDVSAEIADAVWDEDATGHQTQGTFGQAIGDPVADTNSIYKAVVSDATGATVGVDVVALKAETVNILADTNELQTDWVNGGRLDLILDARASQTSVDTIDGIVDAILVDTAEIGVAGAGLTNINLPDQTMNITGNITGNLSGSVGSVSGAVGSVTGAVGSVTGNVGGNVTGSVGSVATGGITAASFAAGAIDAAAIAADAIGSSELAASAITEIQAGLSTLDAAGVRTAIGLASANLDTQLSTIDTVVDAILVDTGTTLDGKIDVIDGIVDAILVDTAEIGVAGAGLTNINLPDQTMNITGDITGNLSGSVGSVSGAVGSVTGAVGSVTGNVGGNVTGSVGSLAAQAKIDVNAEVVDVLATDTYAEPGQGAPSATTTLAAKINYLYKAFRNKSTQTATTYSLYADDATTVDQKATVSDDATTFTRGEIVTGP